MNTRLRAVAARAGRTLSPIAMTGLLVAGCAAPEVPQEPITWSAEWFQCDTRFDCIAVYDDYCKYEGVNARYSLVYQDWVRQQVQESGELRPCHREREQDALTAYCRSGRCEYP